jgi:hypothetical protein
MASECPSFPRCFAIHLSIFLNWLLVTRTMMGVLLVRKGFRFFFVVLRAAVLANMVTLFSSRSLFTVMDWTAGVTF